MAVLAIVAGLLVVPSLTREAGAASSSVTVCHRTHSTTNPYRRITVSQNAITRNQGHGDHLAAPGNPGVFTSTFAYPAGNTSWGDIVPGGDAEGLPYNGANNIDLNWTVDGKALFLSAACARTTAKQFYDIEIAAGVPEPDVLADLNSQGANEDVALLAALGGTFTAANVAQWDTALKVTTVAATSVGATTATLRGSLTVGPTSTVTGFDYGTSATLATSTSVAAVPATVAGSGQASSAALTGLASNQTYYFRATGVTNAGASTEMLLQGDILSFTTTGVAVQTITFDQPAAMALGGATRTLTVATAAPSGLPVTFTSDSPGICTVAGAVVTAVSDGTCSITATQDGDVTYAPATAVTRTFAVTAVGRTLAIDAGSFDAGGYLRTATPPTITAAPSDGAGAVTFSTSTPGVCTIDAATGVVVFVDVGACTIGATIAAAGFHASATAAPVTFTVSHPPTTTTATDATTVLERLPVPGPTVPTTLPATTTSLPRATSTTVPRPATSVAPGPETSVDLPPVQGAIRGLVWFDRNGNGRHDGREWILPGVTVTLVRSGAAATAGTAAAAATSTSTVSGADGTYAFTGLPPGGYEVAASATIDGFDYTSDSDGTPDWIVGLGVAADRAAVADFAGNGRGTLVGKMFEVDTNRGLAHASVTCRWGGFDDVLGNADDVLFDVLADGDGTFDLRGVPYGNFRCAGTDGTGRRSATGSATVRSPVPVNAELAVDPPPGGGLPVTGSPAAALLAMALLCLNAGLVLVRVERG